MAIGRVGPAALMALACTGRAQAQTPAQPPPARVEGLVVTAVRPQVQSLLDRKVYTVTSDLQAHAGVAADVLNKIPSVTVDADGAISVRGDPNVTILVDGKASAQFTGPAQALSLLQFPASDIDRIEVLTHPPAQYKAEGSGGVINIVTRKTRRAGFVGSARASFGQEGRYVLGLDGAYNRGPLKLSAGLGVRQDAKDRLTTSDQTTVDPDSGETVRARQSLDERLRRRIPNVSATLGYDLSPSRTLGATFSHRELSGVRWFDQHDETGPPSGALAAITDRHSDGREWESADAKGVTFEQRLWRPHETLSASLQRSVYREREPYAYRNTYTLPAQAPTFDTLRLSLDLVKSELSVDYDLQSANDRELKLGIDLEADRNAYDDVGDNLDPVAGVLIPNPAIANHFRYRQQVDAAYADYQRPFGAWRLDAGLRIEATHVSFRQINGETDGGRNDVGAYPSLHLDHRLGEDARLSVAISRRVTRPDPQALNPFADTQDTHNLRAGNPDLKPQDTWSYEVGWLHEAKLSYGATAYYRFDRNSFSEVVQPISADVVVTTKENLPKRRSAGIELHAAGRLAPGLSYNASADAFHAQVNAGGLGGSGLASATGVNMKASVDWRPTPADDAQVSFSRADRRLTPQGFVEPTNLVNLGYRHEFSPAVSLVVTVADLFNGQRQIRHVLSPALTEVYERRQFGRVAYAGLAYSFGGPKKAKSAFDYDQ